MTVWVEYWKGHRKGHRKGMHWSQSTNSSCFTRFSTIFQTSRHDLSEIGKKCDAMPHLAFVCFKTNVDIKECYAMCSDTLLFCLSGKTSKDQIHNWEHCNAKVRTANNSLGNLLCSHMYFFEE